MYDMKSLPYLHYNRYKISYSNHIGNNNTLILIAYVKEKFVT